MSAPLSAVVSTFNEAANIAHCRQAQGSVADEGLVVDSFSADNSVEIYPPHGARVIRHAIAGISA